MEVGYVGIAKTYTQCVLEAITYDLYRLPAIVVAANEGKMQKIHPKEKKSLKRGDISKIKP
jgi:hypothetical protein